MEGSPKSHKRYENHLKANGITSGKTALHSFSDTRWTARTDNLEVVMNVYPALLSMFKEESEQNNDSVATGLLVRLIPFRFVAACQILVKCFSLSTHASEYLQREDMDLTSGVTAIQDLKATIASFRTDEQFDLFIKEANSFAEKWGSEVLDVSFSDASPTASQTKRRRRLPTHLADGQSILDMSTLQNNHQMANQPCEMISLSATFHPRNLTEENVPKVEKIAQFYKRSSHRVGQQFLLFSKSKQCDDWKNAYKKHKNQVKERKEKGLNENSPVTPWVCLPSLLDVFSDDDLHHLYPDLFEVIKIVATLPVTVASCERTHSKVKIINNYLRAAMSPERL
ncbi:uncharacterized protein LOC114539612 [Dendronephthya gigantea]|uniref:uncharacterized protein LOC114539612 n=1 Tax=Dendronephthya gigantea TaxID=151771 RepID=UPI001069086A|nr:uncharacterized protein LOC114539612 [Dendronephthya gigantea]